MDIEIIDITFDAQLIGWEVAYVATTDDGEEDEREGFVQGRYEVCDRCRGKGKHTNPAIDGNGITASEWADWDEDEREGYFRGRYDVRCEECKGEKVVAVVDLPPAPAKPDALAVALEDHFYNRDRDAAEAASERMWEARMLYGANY